ncbi:hypothetical protein Tco_1102456 [Tanacetum coccineum]
MRQGSPYHTVDNDEMLDRLKFINNGDIYQVYGKPILDTWITDEIKKSEAYKMYFKYSTSLIPPKKGRGRGAQGTKATDAPKQTNVVCKKTTVASKKKQPKRKLVLHDESEGEPHNRPTGKKKRMPRVVVIQEPPSVPVKKTQVSSGKLKGIELLYDEAREGAGLRPEVPDELTGKSTDSDEGAGTSPEVSDESEDKSEAKDDLDDWGSTDDEEYLLAYKDEKPEDILWQSTDDDVSENNDEEDESDDDKSIDIEKTNDERMNTDVEDQVKGVAKMNIDEKVEEENTKRVEEQKEDEELKAEEELKGDYQAGDEQLVIHVSTTQRETPSLPQSTSNHLVSSNFGNPFINSPNASLIGTIPENTEAEMNSLLDIQIQQDVPYIQQEPFHAVKVSVIPEATQVPPTTPPAPPLPATKIPSTQVSNSRAVKSIIQIFTELEQAVKELKQADHSTSILASIKSQELSEKRDYKDVIEKSVQAYVINEVKNFRPKFLPKAVKEALEKTPLSLELFGKLTWSMLIDEANKEKGDKPDSVPKKRDRGDDQDEDPLVGSNQGKKTKKRRFNESESSKKTSTAKESSKGKSLANTSKSGKYVTAEEPVEELVFEKALDDAEQTFDDNIDTIEETQADVVPKILKKDWFKYSPKPKHLLTFDELMSTPIDFSAFAMNRLKLDKITREILLGLLFNLLKGTCKSCVELEYNMEDCYCALIYQLDWANLEAGNKERMYSSFITKTPTARYTMEGIEEIIPTLRSQGIIAYDKDVEKIYVYGHLKEIVVRRADQKLYMFKEGDFLDLHLNDIEDMLLLIAQNKLFNLYGDVIVNFVIAIKMFTRGIIVKKRVEDMQLGVESYQRKLSLTKPQRTCQHISVKEPCTPNYDPPRIIYEDKNKKKRLMRADEVHKFCDETLQSLRKILCERLLNFKFGYNKDKPLREWTPKDKKRTGIMVNKIDDQLFKRRILRSLEVLVGGRKIEKDKRLLQRTV